MHFCTPPHSKRTDSQAENPAAFCVAFSDVSVNTALISSVSDD